MKVLVLSFTLIVLSSLPLSNLHSTQIYDISFPTQVNQFEKLEIRFNLDTQYLNPFEPSEVDASAEIIAPSGKFLTVPAFYTQDFDRILDGGIEKFIAKGASYWAVRFTPVESGTYSFNLRVNDFSGENRSESLTFESITSSSRGFVKVNMTNPHYFVFDNGEPYIPLGFNISWADNNNGSFYYDYFLQRLADAGGNWVRIWMTHYFQGLTIEWGDYHPSGLYNGLGFYSLEVAERLDRIVEQAKKSGIYIQLVLQHHSAFETLKWSSWDDNPYNIKNGGMLNNSMEFFTNAEANKFFDNRLRYIIARWGYSPHILAWELWNEVDAIIGYYDNNNIENVKLWHQDKIKKIKNLDVHQHLVTTSFSLPYFLDRNQFWNMEGIDYTQYHAYLGPVFGIEYPMVESARTLSQFNKPTFAGEFGIDWLGAFNKDDPQGINIHNGIWSSLLSGNAGSGMSWWWYNYIEPNNLWKLLKPAYEFVKNEDFTEFTEVFTEGLGIDNPSDIEVIGIRSEKKSFFWVHNKESVWNNSAEPGETTGIIVNLENLTFGQYNIEFWDTINGTIVNTNTVNINSSPAKIEIPAFTRDIAAKVKYTGAIKEGCGCSARRGSPESLILVFLPLIMLICKRCFTFYFLN